MTKRGGVQLHDLRLLSRSHARGEPSEMFDAIEEPLDGKRCPRSTFR